MKSFIVIEDEIRNEGGSPAPLTMLYHINFGYPMLDGGAKIRLNCEKSEGLTEKAQNNIAINDRIFFIRLLECVDNTFEVGNLERCTTNESTVNVCVSEELLSV